MKKITKIIWLFMLTVFLSTGITEAQTKKKMSSRKKGALIGAGTGVATGIIVSKNDSKGAIIGGVAGAGTGYLYGRQRDKKKGRLRK
jgi:hypothetical protein